MQNNVNLKDSQSPTEIVRMRNHFTYIFEQMWGIIAVILAMLLGNAESFELAAKLISQGNILEGLLALGGTFLVLLLICLWFVNRWYKTSITVKDGTVTIERRTLNRYVNAIAVQNISNINLEQNLFEILMGTYKLKLDTNSLSTASTTDVKIVLKKKDAYMVKNLIMKMMKEAEQEAEQEDYREPDGVSRDDSLLAENTKAFDVDMMEEQEEDFYDVTYSIKEILINCLVDTSITLVLFALAFFVSTIITAVATIGTAGSILASLGGFLIQVVVAGSMIAAIIKQWLNDFRFRAKRYKDKIYVSCGLIKRRKYAVPVDKINAVCFQATFLGRLSKRAYVKVINVGGEDEDVDGMKILLAGTQEELKQRLAILLPEFTFPEKANIQKQPKRALVRQIVLSAIYQMIFWGALFAGFALAAYKFDGGLPSIPVPLIVGVPLALFVLQLVGKLLAYKVTGFAVSEEYLVISRGMFAASTTAIPYKKIQYLQYMQGPIERRLGLQRANVFILASAFSQMQAMGEFSVEDYDRITEHFRKTY